jgi:DNA-binding LytR/AlgR family response regulator
LFVKYRNQFIKVAINKIEWLSAENNYTTIHTQKRKYIIRNSLTNILEIINKKEFLRVYCSYAVNAIKIDVIERTKLIISDQEVPIGRSFQQEIISQIKVLTGE